MSADRFRTFLTRPPRGAPESYGHLVFGLLAVIVFGGAYVIAGTIEVIGVVLPSMFLLIGVAESLPRKRQATTTALRALAIAAGIIGVVWYFGGALLAVA